MSVNFLQTDKKSKYKIIYFLAGVGGGGGWWGGGGGVGGLWRGGAGVSIMYKCLKWHFYSSRTTNVEECRNAQIQKKWSRQAQFMTILLFDLQVCP